MKKILTAVCALAFLLTMSACSDATADVSNKKTAIVTIGGTKITNGDVYSALKASGDISYVEEAMTIQVVNNAVETTEEIEAEAQETLATLKESIGDDEWETYITELGYDDEDDFYENYILYTIKSEYLTTTYVEELYDEFYEELEIRKLQIMQVDSDNLSDIVAALEDGEDFYDVAQEYGILDTYDGSAAIYTNEDDISATVWSIMLETEDGTYSDTVVDTTTSYQYIIYVVSSDADEIKEEAIEALAASEDYTNDDGLSIDEEAFNYYLNKLGYSIHDVEIYEDLLSDSYMYEED